MSIATQLISVFHQIFHKCTTMTENEEKNINLQNMAT